VKRVRDERRRQRMGVFAILLFFELVLLLLQLWLFVSVLEGTVEGGSPIAATAAVVSAVCFGINTWMLLGVMRMDRG
jgi:hypothetical protein